MKFDVRWIYTCTCNLKIYHLVPAGGGVDYTSIVNQSLSFSPSVAQVSVPVAITNDSLVEIIETFTALLTEPMIDRLTIDPPEATITIPNDDRELRLI